MLVHGAGFGSVKLLGALGAGRLPARSDLLGCCRADQVRSVKKDGFVVKGNGIPRNLRDVAP